MKQILIVTSLIFLGFAAKAQNASVINSSGKSAKMDTFIHDYNVGEIVVSTILAEPEYVTQGFLQPMIFWSDVTKDYRIKLINNYISPNGDGKNDFLVFEGLENFKVNKLIIVDRAGRMIFSKINYKNDWDGRLNGKDLSEDTYYWILEYGDNNKLKGFVSITHDGQ
ncbi:gliding motility-associated C-terminal domain-containing protein [Pedobacter jeongneungensis]|uniref:gliding motility-associated C-terminal domain-containing protein n=1 Tax=Pedobacter jeongneungensis TaxID=947309 RepID=UPI0004693F2C|nr:T9SS C-terminal target domain-containing protein [Pedobacter jeongneungensis]